MFGEMDLLDSEEKSITHLLPLDALRASTDAMTGIFGSMNELLAIGSGYAR